MKGYFATDTIHQKGISLTIRFADHILFSAVIILILLVVKLLRLTIELPMQNCHLPLQLAA